MGSATAKPFRGGGDSLLLLLTLLLAEGVVGSSVALRFESVVSRQFCTLVWLLLRWENSLSSLIGTIWSDWDEAGVRLG